jgi:hypothetical protein
MGRASVLCMGLVTVMLAPTLTLSSASAAPTTGTRASPVCRHTAYTGDGGYFSQTFFFWEANDTVTVDVHWCSSGGVITSKTVTSTTTIPNSLDPRITESDGFSRGGSVLKVSVGGDYESGVLNNVGFILLVGHVSADGHRHFKNLSAAGG